MAASIKSLLVMMVISLVTVNADVRSCTFYIKETKCDEGWFCKSIISEDMDPMDSMCPDCGICEPCPSAECPLLDCPYGVARNRGGFDWCPPCPDCNLYPIIEGDTEEFYER